MEKFMLLFLVLASHWADAANSVKRPRGRPLYHNLKCTGALPSFNWPEGLDRNDYADKTAMCAWAGQKPTMGCICVNSHHVECLETLAAPAMWQNRHWLQYCRSGCECEVEDREPENVNITSILVAANAAATRERIGGEPEATDTDGAVFPMDEDPPVGSWGPEVPDPSTQRAGTGVNPSEIQRQTMGGQGQCAAGQGDQSCSCQGRCTSVKTGCSRVFPGGCKCTARPDQVRKGRFVGQCGIIISGSWGLPKSRRDDNGTARAGSVKPNFVLHNTQGLYNITTGTPVACPCNATYVSYGCCESSDGLIWENPAKRLGELV
ncbi:MAG: hypothetical protein M1817_005157 [Caeruleum heppii]|nr:MAG: hypothetical protein M1817_005157 [Caeruleum heppii]